MKNLMVIALLAILSSNFVQAGLEVNSNSKILTCANTNLEVASFFLHHNLSFYGMYNDSYKKIIESMQELTKSTDNKFKALTQKQKDEVLFLNYELKDHFEYNNHQLVQYVMKASVEADKTFEGIELVNPEKIRGVNMYISSLKNRLEECVN